MMLGCSGVLLMLLVGVSCHHTKIVELSHTLQEGIPYYPTVEKFHLNVTHNGTRDGYWYQMDKLSGSTHSGTHIDAPCHFHKGGLCVSDITLDNLVAPAVVVDIRHKIGDNSDYTLSVDDLEEWEKANGRIPDGSVLLVATGWDRYWKDSIKYLGSAEKDPTKLHFPGVSHEAAQWLADNRKLVGIGLDTISLDAGQASIPKAHTILAERNVYHLENLANLGALPPTGATVYSLPLKINGASGAPARVIAILGDSHHHHGSAASTMGVAASLFLVCVMLTSKLA